MAVMQQPARTGEGTYEESIEESEGWKLVRRYLKAQKMMVDGTFKVKGTIKKFIFDNGGYFETEFTDKATGKVSKRSSVKVVAAITDPRFGQPGILELPPKGVGVSFFDGKRGSQPRSPIRGGLYSIHLAVTHQEPPQELVKGGPWDNEPYEGQPLLLNLVYKGTVEEDSPYHGKRANMTLFINGFERDPDSPNYVSDLDDDDSEDVEI